MSWMSLSLRGRLLERDAFRNTGGYYGNDTQGRKKGNAVSNINEDTSKQTWADSSFNYKSNGKIKHQHLQSTIMLQQGWKFVGGINVLNLQLNTISIADFSYMPLWWLLLKFLIFGWCLTHNWNIIVDWNALKRHKCKALTLNPGPVPYPLSSAIQNENSTL